MRSERTTRPGGRTTARRTASLLLAGAGLLCAAGCNIVAPIAIIFDDPRESTAKFKLDPERKTVVLVDDRNNALPKRSLRAAIGLEADQSMIEEKVVEQPNMIAAQSALHVVAAERLGSPKSIVDVGKAVGADVIIYVSMDAFSLSKDGVLFQPFAVARVKVLDCVNNTRLWPPDERGYPITAQMPEKREQVPTQVAERNAAELDLARFTGREVARLFFTYFTESASRAR